MLTVADIRGTSPKVWNAWKGKLLEDLYWSTRRFLGGDTNPAGSRLQSRQQLALQKLKLYALPEGVHTKLWAQLDTPYFLRHDAREIAWHTRLLNYRVDAAEPVVKARLSPVGEGVQVMIYTPDRKNLFAQICAFFERIGFSIVEAKVYTTLHGYALDTFQVLDPNKATTHYRDLMDYIEHELSEQLKRDGPLPPPTRGSVSRRVRSFPITPEVSVRPDERGRSFYLNFTAGDRPGLLSSVARILVDYGIEVLTAKINTLGERAEDSFVIRGDALRETRNIIRLESDLIRALQLNPARLLKLEPQRRRGAETRKGTTAPREVMHVGHRQIRSRLQRVAVSPVVIVRGFSRSVFVAFLCGSFAPSRLCGSRGRPRSGPRRQQVLAAFDAVQPGEQLGHGNVELRRDALIEIHLHEQRDQLGRLVHVDTSLARALDDRLRQQPSPLGDDARRALLFLVGQGDRQIGRIRLGHRSSPQIP